MSKIPNWKKIDVDTWQCETMDTIVFIDAINPHQYAVIKEDQIDGNRKIISTSSTIKEARVIAIDYLITM